MSDPQDPVAETQTEAAALPPLYAVGERGPELFVPRVDDTVHTLTGRTGVAFHIENPSGDNRTPSRVRIYDAAGRESWLEGVVGFSVDSVRGVLTLELRPEHLYVEHVANAPA